MNKLYSVKEVDTHDHEIDWYEGMLDLEDSVR